MQLVVLIILESGRSSVVLHVCLRVLIVFSSFDEWQVIELGHAMHSAHGFCLLGTWRLALNISNMEV